MWRKVCCVKFHAANLTFMVFRGYIYMYMYIYIAYTKNLLLGMRKSVNTGKGNAHQQQLKKKNVKSAPSSKFALTRGKPRTVINIPTGELQRQSSHTVGIRLFLSLTI